VSSAQLHDSIGVAYTVTRRTEPRIAAPSLAGSDRRPARAAAKRDKFNNLSLSTLIK
jgi:hypothetical protein